MSDSGHTGAERQAAVLFKLLHEASLRNHRLCALLSGEPGWLRALTDHIARSSLRVWRPADGHPGRGRIDRILGREIDAALLELFGEKPLQANLLAATTGALRGGGLLLLLTPPVDSWPTSGRELERRVAQHLLSAPTTCHLQQNLQDRLPLSPGTERQPLQDVSPFERQKLLIGQLVNARKVVVITADRGRGKSAALGLAAAERIVRNSATAPPISIVVTAPTPGTTGTLFAHARQRIEAAGGEWINATNGLRHPFGKLTFMAPDRVAAGEASAELLLVDEAAALPTPLLERLLKHHPLSFFATTIHGYEGGGRGFTIRFGQYLEQNAPGWRLATLEQPLRWRSDDPLEPLINQALLLDSPPDNRSGADQTSDRAACHSLLIKRIGTAELAADEPLLRRLFALLIEAHYRTTPDDLGRLLDDPTRELLVAFCDGEPAALLLAVSEGGFDRSVAAGILEGRRRPRGHLVAQSLTFHAALPAAATLHDLRIVRIATDHRLRRRGIATRLVASALEQARERGADLLAVSFGLEPELLQFWRRMGLKPVHVGFRRDHASAAHSLMAMLPLG